MNGLAHRVVAAEAERRWTRRPTPGAGQVAFDPARGLDEVDGVVGVLFNAGGHGEDVGVEDDVFGRKPTSSTRMRWARSQDFDLARKGVGLALLVKRHDHGGGAVALDQLGLLLERLHAALSC